jgi:propanol-preferring alcohol dehydrogenase
MQAALFTEGKLVVKDVPKPKPANEEALIRITSAGVCHSDVHFIKGDWLGKEYPFPIPLGHEGIGIVEELGTGTEKFIKVGDRVILGLGGTGGGYWCGACEYCLSGRSMLCKESKGINGVYAEYISLWAKSLVKLPAEVPDSEVSLACGGLTAYGAISKLFKFGVMPGKTIAIVGAAGGLGHYGVQIAKTFGYKVLGIDVGADKIDFVKKIGADYAVDANDAAKFVKEKLGGVYASIIFSSKIAGFQLGLKILKRGGIFVGVGMPAVSEGPISITPLELLMKSPIIMPSAVGTVDDMRTLVQLAVDGKVKTHVSKYLKLSQLNEVLEELYAGKYIGRAVINDLTK